MKTVTFSSCEQLYDAAADLFIQRAQRSIAERGRFLVALCGGRDAVALYRRLGEPSASDRIHWASVHVLWSDERCVPPDDEASHSRAAHDALLDRVPVPPANVHRIDGERPPLEAADAYEVSLRELLGKEGRIDLVLLHLGADGHTASLFPRHQALTEIDRWILPVHVSREPPWRVTMTLPLINAARAVLFFVTGREKEDAVRRVLAGEDLPATRVRPTDGDLIWLLDREAASSIA